MTAGIFQLNITFIHSTVIQHQKHYNMSFLSKNLCVRVCVCLTMTQTERVVFFCIGLASCGRAGLARPLSLTSQQWPQMTHWDAETTQRAQLMWQLMQATVLPPPAHAYSAWLCCHWEEVLTLLPQLGLHNISFTCDIFFFLLFLSKLWE